MGSSPKAQAAPAPIIPQAPEQEATFKPGEGDEEEREAKALKKGKGGLKVVRSGDVGLAKGIPTGGTAEAKKKKSGLSVG